MAAYAGAHRALFSVIYRSLFFGCITLPMIGLSNDSRQSSRFYLPIGIGSAEQIIPCSVGKRKGTHAVRVFSYINTHEPYDVEHPQVDTYIDIEPLTAENERDVMTMRCVDLDKHSGVSTDRGYCNWRMEGERAPFYQTDDWLGIRVTPDITIWVKKEYDGVFADEVTTLKSFWRSCWREKKTFVADRYHRKDMPVASSLALWQQCCALVCEIVFSGATYLPYYNGEFKSSFILHKKYSRDLCWALFHKEIAIHRCGLLWPDNESFEAVRTLQAAYLAKIVCRMSASESEPEAASSHESEDKSVAPVEAYEVLDELAKDFHFDPEWAVHKDEKVLELSSIVKRDPHAVKEVIELYYSLIDATKKVARREDRDATSEDFHRSFAVLYTALSTGKVSRGEQLTALMAYLTRYATEFDDVRHMVPSDTIQERAVLHRMLAYIRDSGEKMPALVRLMPIIALTRLLQHFDETSAQASALFPKWCGEVALCAASHGSDRLAISELLRVLICLVQQEAESEGREATVVHYREVFNMLLKDALTAEAHPAASRRARRAHSSIGDHRAQTTRLLELATEKMSSLETDSDTSIAALQALLELLKGFSETKAAASHKLVFLLKKRGVRKPKSAVSIAAESFSSSSTPEHLDEAEIRRSPALAFADEASSIATEESDNPLDVGLLSGQRKRSSFIRSWLTWFMRPFVRG